MHAYRKFGPTIVSRSGTSLQFGRTSAPINPHRLHTMRGSTDFSTTSSAKKSASIVALCQHRKPLQ
jgi:hypothetical protein